MSRCDQPRPLLRGWLHAGAFAAAIPAAVLLIVFSRSGAARVAAAIYAATLLAGFGTSAAYHRLARSERARKVMQRADHGMIYVLIAGTYTPVCLVVLPPRWGIPLLAVVGGLTVVGIVLKLTAFERLAWLSYALYPITGWAALAATPALVEHLTTAQLALIVGGGLAYTIGFPVLLVKRPDPWPRVFGYHEVWHVFTIVAALAHFVAVSQVVA